MNTLFSTSQKTLILAIMVGIILLCSDSLMAQEPNWRESYQSELAGNYKKALAAIEPVKSNGADAELKTLRKGWLYYLLGSYDESIREYRLAIDRNNESIDARLGVILPLLAKKRWREAEQSARSVLDLAPNNYYALLRLSIALEGQQEWRGMAEIAEKLVISYPSDINGYLYLARANAWLIKPKAAATAYKAVLTRLPDHLEATAYLRKAMHR
jgi:tetratricopeptide (TPR) repeat protein